MSYTTVAPLCQRPVYNPRRLQNLVPIVEDHLRALQPELQFNAIACRGLSSIPIASIIAYKLGVSLLAVRRAMASDVHSMSKVHGAFHSKTRYVIIDDLIDSGATIRRIVKDVRNVFNDEGFPGFGASLKLVGIFLYEGGGIMQLEQSEFKELDLPRVPIFWPYSRNRKKLERMDP